MSVCWVALAATLLAVEKNGVSLAVDADVRTVDPAKSVFLDVTLSAPRDVKAEMPDLRDRVRGFSLAEDFEDEPSTAPDGRLVRTTHWKLVPEPCAETYKIAPFLVKASPRLLSAQTDEGRLSFVAGPVYFDNPPPREIVTGGIETDPQKDLPPLSWKLVGYCGAAFAALVAALAALWFGLRYLARRVREHRMSPIERAWAELDRLVKRGLPGRGRYKDFYVELTMVVRRYIQRKYGIRAPNLTTEEFLREAKPSDELRRFLESADLVKFAGVEATPEMADDATEGARKYLRESEKSEAAAPQTAARP